MDLFFAASGTESNLVFWLSYRNLINTIRWSQKHEGFKVNDEKKFFANLKLDNIDTNIVNRSNELHVCFAFELLERDSFETLVKSIKIAPTQIFRPGDRHPVTGKILVDQNTGGDLKTFSWELSEPHTYLDSSIDLSNINTYLESFLSLLNPYKDSLSDIYHAKKGGVSLDVGWGIDLKKKKNIWGPHLQSEIWKGLNELKAEFSFSYIDTQESGMEENEEELELFEITDETSCSMDFYMKVESESAISVYQLEEIGFRQSKAEKDQFVFSTKNQASTDMRDHHHYFLKKISPHIEFIKDLNVKKNLILTRMDLPLYNEGIIFSPEFISILASLNAGVLMTCGY